MNEVKRTAEQVTMQSFANCYVRETGHFQLMNSSDFPRMTTVEERVIACELSHQNLTLIFPVRYWSLTGRHQFAFPFYMQPGEDGVLLPLDYISLVALITKELSLNHGRGNTQDELMLRVILSCQNLNKYIESRKGDSDRLVQGDFDFIEAEQSLLLGHLLHPTPKSKQGITEKEDNLYSPEMKGEFQLHYFKAEQDVIIQDSSLQHSAGLQMINQLQDDPEISQEMIEQILNEQNNAVLFPVHPLQAQKMLEDQGVRELLEKDQLEYIGPLGSPYSATSSFRTVYRQDSEFMYKFSIPIKITNSLRVNQQKELDRGVEISKLLDTEMGSSLYEAFPSFEVIQDPAYLKLLLPNAGSTYDVVLRRNPFYEGSRQVTLVAGLCQDHAYSEQSRLQVLIEQIAANEGRTAAAVSHDWFDRYLSLTLEPLLWLYKKYGIVLEAHQQNSIVKLEDGYPVHFYYRDNQGYYFSQSKAEHLRKILPDLNKKSDTVCADDIADERFRYYFFLNHLFGLINSFGMKRLISEEQLMELLHERLKEHEEEYSEPSALLNSLLYEDKLPCKANLLTRFYDMDELTGSLENQSVYTLVDNPLYRKVESVHGI
ncbi:IucA/IucC family protein [Halobacillus naozhouensis]|uniref:IucA/IucC family protein n=1 Tax=Halobacillus naozhouensis TaxID=554880 RepID=A0ABY8IWU2_9BACI|nr:IucA/IucC family protein [Halobacillus naozhouensis]WFT73688.1 IucA/IucC family protein [Halobacillus naozhouensis]